MKFLNCEMEFECPQDWDGMIMSSDVNVRHCSACNKDVHFCHTVEDLKKAVNAKCCVTYISGDVTGNVGDLVELISNLENSKKSELRLPRISRTTGIPAGYMGSQSLFESADDEDQLK